MRARVIDRLSTCRACSSNRRAQPAPGAASVLASSARSPHTSRPLLRTAFQARCASGGEPRSSFACPRLSASPIQPCPPPRAIRLRAAVGGAALRALRCASGTRQRHRLPARWPCASRAPLLCSSRARGACAPASRCGGQSGKPSRRERELRAVRWRGLGSARECGAPREVRRGPASLRSHHAAFGFGCRLRLALAAARNLPLLWPSPRAWRRCESAAVQPLPPPFPATSPAVRRWRWNGSRGSRACRARALAAVPSQLPWLGGNMLRAALARLAQICGGEVTRARQPRGCPDALALENEIPQRRG